jgi:hypothetical protein
VQWQVSTDGGSTYSNISGETGNTLSLSKPSVSASGNKYQAVYTNSCNGSKTATTQPATLTVAARAITVTAASDTRAYNGTTSSSATPTITSGSLVSGDTANFSESFLNKNAGTGRTLVPAGSVNDGNLGLNYAVTFANNTTGVITARPITVTAVTDSKGYDCTTSSGKTPTITSGTLGSGDTANFTQSFG